MHVWWNIHSIGQANQKPILNIASMLLLGGLGNASPRKKFKITCSEIESESIFKNIYRDHSHVH